MKSRVMISATDARAASVKVPGLGWRMRRRGAALAVAHDADGRAWEVTTADSVEEYLPADAGIVGPAVDRAIREQGSAWAPKWADAVRQCSGQGLADGVVASMERGRELVRTLAIPATSARWIHSEEGYRVDVAAYCRGEERSMLRRRRSVADAAPMRVLVAWSAPGATPAETLAERAGVIAGMVDELSTVRPVELRALNVTASDYYQLGDLEHGLAIASVGVPLGDPLRVAGIIGPAGARTIEVVTRQVARAANGYPMEWRNYGAYGGDSQKREPILASLGLFDADADVLIPPPNRGEDIASSGWFRRLRAMIEGRAAD